MSDDDMISRHAAIDALWKALFEYEDKTEKQFLESDELDLSDWMVHRIFVQNMSDIDRETILNLPSVQPDIVRCKDCKYHDPEGKSCGCGHDIIWQLPRDDNWFCADGKRMVDDPSHPFADDVMMGERRTDE